MLSIRSKIGILNEVRKAETAWSIKEGRLSQPHPVGQRKMKLPSVVSTDGS